MRNQMKAKSLSKHRESRIECKSLRWIWVTDVLQFDSMNVQPTIGQHLKPKPQLWSNRVLMGNHRRLRIVQRKRRVDQSSGHVSTAWAERELQWRFVVAAWIGCIDRVMIGHLKSNRVLTNAILKAVMMNHQPICVHFMWKRNESE